ncbi:fluoride efflux transporter FluC [Bifidobacterium panos]|uniref:Fluoride-specific ion channel FluC n=1 Tax=Bifidobacterium panos TaxID=2675321 RepID=A0ABX1SVF8_9BIFI|nr:CrcB family protein [Bifidobacterium sp. DSM 109963]NMN01818.1 camphor resistance protein CrcB [Bifidobacterium sp. DSM 109963]
MNTTEQFPQTPVAAPLTDVAQADIAEPAPSTQEMSVAHAKLYAQPTPHPTGAAAVEQPPQIPLAPIKRVRAQFNPLADGMLYLVVFLGGCLGTAMRYGMTQLFPQQQPASQGMLSAFHTATFCSNMIACFIFAALTEYVSQASWIRKRTRQLTSRGVGMGMCGGFSTLSAMVIEELTAIRGGQIASCICYTLASFICGLLVAAVGVRFASALALRHMSRVIGAAEAASRMEAAVQGGNVGAPSVDVSHAAGGSATSGIPTMPSVSAVPDISAMTGTAGISVISSASVLPDVSGESSGISSDVSNTFGALSAARAESSASQTGNDGQSFAEASATRMPGAGVVELPAFEPTPVTDEIPLVGDLSTGEAVEVQAVGSEGVEPRGAALKTREEMPL